jgi:3-hydroxybutyryl-CoA dehydratase
MHEYIWEDLRLGLKHGFDAIFTAADAAAFQKISGDTNPLHADKSHALAHGFPSPVLYGLLTSSLYSRLAGVYLPGRYAFLQGIDIDFCSPCHAGEPLRCDGEVVFLSEAFRRFEVKATIRKMDHTLVSKAKLRIGFHGQ